WTSIRRSSCARSYPQSSARAGRVFYGSSQWCWHFSARAFRRSAKPTICTTSISGCSRRPTNGRTGKLRGRRKDDEGKKKTAQERLIAQAATRSTLRVNRLHLRLISTLVLGFFGRNRIVQDGFSTRSPIVMDSIRA